MDKHIRYLLSNQNTLSWTNRCGSGIPHLCSSSGRDIEHWSLLTKNRKVQHGQKAAGWILRHINSKPIQRQVLRQSSKIYQRHEALYRNISHVFPLHIFVLELVPDLWAELLQTINVKSSLRARLALCYKVTRPCNGYTHNNQVKMTRNDET